jgi:transcriptional regulator of acetoin/glycerol metabolism
VLTPWLESVKDEKERLMMALGRTNGNRKEAAALLGISRATFYRRLEQYGLGSSASR